MLDHIKHSNNRTDLTPTTGCGSLTTSLELDLQLQKAYALSENQANQGRESLVVKKSVTQANHKVTTKELAEMLGVTTRIIQITVKELAKKNSRLFEHIESNSQGGYLFNEAQATSIKIELQNHTKIAKNGFNTLTIANDLEMLEIQRRLSEYQTRRIAELQLQNDNLKIKLDESKEWYSIKRMEKLNKGQHFDWRLLKKESERMGVEIKEVFDANYGKVNAYHISVWESLFFDALNYGD